MLVDWIKDQQSSERYPLLVSHPLKDLTLSSTELERLRERGFDIDRMKDLLVVREIPLWATHLPLALVMSIELAQIKKTPIADFAPQEISSHLWIKIYQETQALEDKSYKVALMPRHFFHE